jgi:hypothetical protein
MTSLSGEDSSGDGEVSTVVNELGGTGVGGNTDVLDQSSERDERLDIGVWAGRSARGNGRKSGRVDLQRVLALLSGILSKSSRKKGNVVVLVTGNLRESSSDPARVASGSKVLLGELGKSVGADCQ